jgi:RNA polymerase sigma-70 factor, ECF subfamily
MSSSFPAARFPALHLIKETETAAPTYKDTVTAPAEDPSDEILIARICADDNEALGLLFRRYARLVWTVGQRILRNNEEADDLLQDVFLFVRRKAAAFDSSKGTIRSFIVHITYQRAISHRRYLTCRHFYSPIDPETESADHAPAPRGPSYDESLEAHFGREGLQRALADLSEEQRETLRLHFFEGYSLEEIAAQIGHSYGNVRHYLYRALEKLRRQVPGKDRMGGQRPKETPAGERSSRPELWTEAK